MPVTTTSRDAASRRLAPRTRRVVLTAHVASSVGLLGVMGAYLAIAISAAGGDPALRDTAYDLLGTFSFLFGIPLSFIALATGIALGVGSKWGVLRSGWVAAKLVLLLSVVLVGAFVLGPAVEEMRRGGDVADVVVAGATYDVVALSLANGFSVFKPRRSR